MSRKSPPSQWLEGRYVPALPSEYAVIDQVFLELDFHLAGKMLCAQRFDFLAFFFFLPAFLAAFFVDFFADDFFAAFLDFFAAFFFGVTFFATFLAALLTLLTAVLAASVVALAAPLIASVICCTTDFSSSISSPRVCPGFHDSGIRRPVKERPCAQLPRTVGSRDIRFFPGGGDGFISGASVGSGSFTIANVRAQRSNPEPNKTGL